MLSAFVQSFSSPVCE